MFSMFVSLFRAIGCMMNIFTHHIHRVPLLQLVAIAAHIQISIQSEMQMIRSLCYDIQWIRYFLDNKLNVFVFFFFFCSIMRARVFSFDRASICRLTMIWCVCVFLCKVWRSRVQIFMSSIRLNWDLKEQSVFFLRYQPRAHWTSRNSTVIASVRAANEKKNGIRNTWFNISRCQSREIEVPITAEQKWKSFCFNPKAMKIDFTMTTTTSKRKFHSLPNAEKNSLKIRTGKRIQCKIFKITFWLTLIYVF